MLRAAAGGARKPAEVHSCSPARPNGSKSSVKWASAFLERSFTALDSQDFADSCLGHFVQHSRRSNEACNLLSGVEVLNKPATAMAS